MKNLYLLADFKSLRLVLWCILNLTAVDSLKSGRLKTKKKLNAVKCNLPFCYMLIRPERLTISIISSLRVLVGRVNVLFEVV